MRKQIAKKHSLFFMLIISILMLIIPAIPHHHLHNSDAICLKIHNAESCSHQEHKNPNNKEPGNCHSFCISHFNFTQDSAKEKVSITPFHFIENDLLTNCLLFLIPKIEVNRHNEKYIYLESLHDFIYIGSIGLRAPPTPSYMA